MEDLTDGVYAYEDEHLRAARRLETEARLQDFETFLILTMLAADFRLRAMGLGGDPSEERAEEPPFIRGWG